jgi:hypothetical protein
MVLTCPHCGTRTAYARGDFSGKWVICHGCEAPFAWQDAQGAPEREKPVWNQARRRRTKETET